MNLSILQNRFQEGLEIHEEISCGDSWLVTPDSVSGGWMVICGNETANFWPHLGPSEAAALGLVSYPPGDGRQPESSIIARGLWDRNVARFIAWAYNNLPALAEDAALLEGYIGEIESVARRWREG
jgi:hypothetical protein